MKGGATTTFAAVLVASSCLLSSCVFDHHYVSAPSAAAPEQDKEWWTTAVETCDLALLAVWARSSEIHLEQHSSAVYQIKICETGSGLGKTVFEKQLPAPIPEAYLVLARKRLASFSGVKREHEPTWLAEVVSAQGCGKVKAMRIWCDAEHVVLPPH